jgi:hypothetical protein
MSWPEVKKCLLIVKMGGIDKEKSNEDMIVVDSKSKTLLLYILWFWKQHTF